ncbi:MAG TPA: hypothetical protein PLP29_04965 [Candidatus Ozemobacteraceae bacterium]|nr:hypothetical protein [Candidatus Ozemobacteraceae bacterium]
MSCNRLGDWIADAERASLERLPEELRRHIGACETCGRLHEAVGGLKRELFALRGPNIEMKEDFENVEKMTKDSTGVPTAPAWKGLLVPAAALCLVVVLAVVFMPGGTGTTPAPTASPGMAAAPAPAPAPQPATTAPVKPAAEAWASVAGQGGTITMPDGSQKQITAEAAIVPAGGGVELTGEKAAVRLAYDSGGTIDVTGKGVIQSRADGFETKDAAFTAAFKRGKKGFAVRVPGAVLGVRGTTIGFALRDGVGSVSLIEGHVAVRPEHADMKEFEWKVGEKLTLAAGRIENIVPTAAPTPAPAPAPTPIAPVKTDPAAVPQNPAVDPAATLQEANPETTGDGSDGFQ